MCFKRKNYVFANAKEALDKLLEVSKGKNFKIDVQPYPGISPDKKNNFKIVKKGKTWYLKIVK